MSATANTVGLLEPRTIRHWKAETDLTMPPFPLASSIPMKVGRNEQAIEILLVEDNAADVRLTRENSSRTGSERETGQLVGT